MENVFLTILLSASCCLMAYGDEDLKFPSVESTEGESPRNEYLPGFWPADWIPHPCPPGGGPCEEDPSKMA